jgi:hypothetical protein
MRRKPAPPQGDDCPLLKPTSATATRAIQSSVGSSRAAGTPITCERETPEESARAVRATGFRFAAVVNS